MTLAMIVEELKSLPPKEFDKAAGYIHALKERRKGERQKMLDETFGCMVGEEGEAFANAIKDCEHVDESSW